MFWDEVSTLCFSMDAHRCSFDERGQHLGFKMFFREMDEVKRYSFATAMLGTVSAVVSKMPVSTLSNHLFTKLNM